MRRAGIVWLGHETIARLLRLPEGQHVRTIHADWLRLGVGVVVEGSDLPEVADGDEPRSLEPGGYVDLDLRPKLEAFVQRYHSDVAPTVAGLAVLSRLREVLAGTLDPRTEMTDELLPAPRSSTPADRIGG